MNIGDVAQQVDLPVKTVRYYEDIGLVSPLRQPNGYREYREREVHVLRFLRRARGLGFSIKDCRSLLSLYGDQGRASAEVRKLAEGRIAEIDRKMAELKSLRSTLSKLVDACHGDDHPDCPILDELAGDPAA